MVIGLLLRSMAPSATIMIFSLFLPARFYEWRKTRYSKTDKIKCRGSQSWRPFSEAVQLEGPDMNFSYWGCSHSGLHAFGLPWLHDPVLTSFTKLDVIAFPCLSMDPSATMIIFSLEPLDRVWGHEHISACHGYTKHPRKTASGETGFRQITLK